MPVKQSYPKIIDDLALGLEEQHEAFTDSEQAFKHLPHIRLETNPDLKPVFLSLLLPGLGHAFIGQETKAFFYFIASGASATLLFSLLVIGNLSLETMQSMASQLENLPLLDITISPNTYKFIESLRFPNPFTISVIIAFISYAALTAWDVLKSSKRKIKAQLLPAYQYNRSAESSATAYAIHIMILLLLIISGIFFVQPKKPKIQVTQIEFIPTQRPSKTAPQNTKRHAAQQSIDSGKHDPKKETAPVTKPPGKPNIPVEKAAPPPKAQENKKEATPPPKPTALPKTVPQAAPKAISQPSPKASTEPKAPSRPIPSPKPTAEPKAFTPSSNSSPSAAPNRFIPKPSNYSGSDASSSSNSSGTAAPAPKSSNAGSSSERSSNLVTRLSNLPRVPSAGSGGASGSAGNPGANPFPNDAASLAAKADVEFGPYMSTLQRKIKLSWEPPRGTESNRIIVLFTIDRMGRLLDLRLLQRSGSAPANQAAIDAIRKAAPFQPLPPGAAEVVDIEFTFDYSVFQKRRF